MGRTVFAMIGGFCLLSLPFAAAVNAQAEHVNWKVVFPSLQELPGFHDLEIGKANHLGVTIEATRPDGLALNFRINLYPTASDASKEIQDIILTRQGGPSDWPVKGSHSGRVLADEQWHDRPKAGGHYRGGTTFMARRDRYVVLGMVELRKNPADGSRLQDRDLSADQLRLAEDVANTVLQRLVRQSGNGK